MSKKQLANELEKLTKELVEATQERDEYEIEYEIEKARMMFSHEVMAFGNQVLRDTQVTLLLNTSGMYEKMARYRTKAKITWYKWSAVKSCIDGKTTDD